jgi:hypothetical protein
MATTLSSTLNDEVISQKAIDAFVAELSPLRSFSTDFSEEISGKGTTVQVPLIANISASATENDYETPSGSAGVVPVPLDRYQKCTVGLTDKQFSESSAAQLEMFATQQAKAVARAVIADIWAIILNAAFSAKTTKASASFTSADVRAIRVALNKLDVPASDRTLILDPDYYDKLIGDTTISIASALHYGGTEVVREGMVPRFLGFALQESNIIPANGENLKGFAVHPGAIAIAMRVLRPQEPSEYLESRTVSDKATGIALGYRRHYAPGKGQHFVTFECVYGRAVGQAAGLHRIVSA